MKWLNLFKFGIGSLAGVAQRYAALLAFLLGAGIVGAMWWNSPSCQERVALEALDLEKKARERAEILATEHAATVINLRLENVALKGRIKDVIPNNPDCDLSRGAVSLLNHSRSGMPETTFDTPDSSSSPSTITQQEAAEQWTSDVLQCREWRSQLLQLIKWHTGG